MAGNSRSVRRVNAMMPSTMSSRLMTVAKTGRWIEMSDRRMSALRRRGCGRRFDDLRAGGQLAGAVDDDAFACADALQDFGLAIGARADRDVDLFDAAI